MSSLMLESTHAAPFGQTLVRYCHFLLYVQAINVLSFAVLFKYSKTKAKISFSMGIKHFSILSKTKLKLINCPNNTKFKTKLHVMYKH